MLIMTISGTSWHFSLGDPRSRSELHMAGTFITISDCLVKSLYFPNHLMDLVNIWYDDRYCSKLPFSNILPGFIGHMGSKTRSLEVRSLKNSGYTLKGLSFDPIFMKLCQNVHLNETARSNMGKC